MRFRCFPLFLGFLLFSIPLTAQAKAPAKIDSREKADMAFLFSFTSLALPLSSYGDGFQSGAGFKYWIAEEIAARALLTALTEPDAVTGTSTTTLGFSAAGEYHLSLGTASPYIGGLIAASFLFDDSGDYIDYALGLFAGVELSLLRNLSLYGEYQALLVRDVSGLAFSIGAKPLLGIAVYF